MGKKYEGVTHNERYEALQAEYLKTRDSKTLGKMYEIAKDAAGNYIRKYCASHGLYHLDTDEMAHDASLFVIEQYLKKPGFSVNKISAYIHFGVMKSLFKDKDREMLAVSWDELMEKKEYKDK
jgi:hypothetical protein